MMAAALLTAVTMLVAFNVKETTERTQVDERLHYGCRLGTCQSVYFGISKCFH